MTWKKFTEVLEKFKKKDTKTYDFLIKSGEKYQKAIFKLCQRVIDNEEVPDSFRKTVLVMIWKRKGSMDILRNNRFLHMKDVLARSVDAMIVSKTRPRRPGFKGHPIEFMIILEPFLGPLWTHWNPFGPIKTYLIFPFGPI